MITTSITAKKKTMSSQVKLIIGTSSKFRRIKDIAAKLGVKMPPRRGYCKVGHLSRIVGEDVSIWCPSFDVHPTWSNTTPNNFDTITEQKNGEARDKFVKRMLNNTGKLNYNLNEIRLTFAKINGTYIFKGAYRMSSIDFDNRTVTFNRVKLLDDSLLVVNIVYSVTVTEILKLSVQIVK